MTVVGHTWWTIPLPYGKERDALRSLSMTLILLLDSSC
jgi:hypothetical protein